MTHFRLELADPWWLLCLAVIPLLYWYHRRSLVDLPARQRQVSMFLRIAILLLLVFCLCGLTLLSPTQDQHVLFLVDESASLGQEARDATQRYIQAALSKQGRNQVSFIRFASTPKTIEGKLPEPPPKTEGATPPPDAAHKEWSQGTDIAAALGVASAALPPSAVGRMVLLSDGNPTQG
ncbi:MAG TPA: vWA domain-containing protein, partial [Gemmatales bacterium]|nr:vWA domain-containing protein [Gemmatales bacterium]